MCTTYTTGAVGGERHCVFDRPHSKHSQGLRQQHAENFDPHDAMKYVM